MQGNCPISMALLRVILWALWIWRLTFTWDTSIALGIYMEYLDITRYLHGICAWCWTSTWCSWIMRDDHAIQLDYAWRLHNTDGWCMTTTWAMLKTQYGKWQLTLWLQLHNFRHCIVSWCHCQKFLKIHINTIMFYLINSLKIAH